MTRRELFTNLITLPFIGWFIKDKQEPFIQDIIIYLDGYDTRTIRKGKTIFWDVWMDQKYTCWGKVVDTGGNFIVVRPDERTKKFINSKDFSSVSEMFISNRSTYSQTTFTSQPQR